MLKTVNFFGSHKNIFLSDKREKKKNKKWISFLNYYVIFFFLVFTSLFLLHHSLLFFHLIFVVFWGEKKKKKKTTDNFSMPLIFVSLLLYPFWEQQWPGILHVNRSGKRTDPLTPQMQKHQQQANKQTQTDTDTNTHTHRDMLIYVSIIHRLFVCQCYWNAFFSLSCFFVSNLTMIYYGEK